MIGGKQNLFLRAKSRKHLMTQLQHWVNVAGPGTHVFVRQNGRHYDGIVLTGDSLPAHLPEKITYVDPLNFGIKREYPAPQHRRDHA